MNQKTIDLIEQMIDVKIELRLSNSSKYLDEQNLDYIKEELLEDV